jgi:DNA-binding MarR family transcriptional regulator
VIRLKNNIATNISALTIDILAYLDGKSACNEAVAFSKYSIADEIESTPHTVYIHINLLLEMGYVAKGFKAGKAIRYYITEAGIKFLEQYNLQ